MLSGPQRPRGHRHSQHHHEHQHHESAGLRTALALALRSPGGKISSLLKGNGGVWESREALTVPLFCCLSLLLHLFKASHSTHFMGIIPEYKSIIYQYLYIYFIIHSVKNMNTFNSVAQAPAQQVQGQEFDLWYKQKIWTCTTHNKLILYSMKNILHNAIYIFIILNFYCYIYL